MFFRRQELRVRCTVRGLMLTVPNRDHLLNACDESQRRQLQQYLGKASDEQPPWEVQWQKMPGDALKPEDVVVVLHRDEAAVELAYAQRGILAEWLVRRGDYAVMGAQLAVLERRAKSVPKAAGSAPGNEILRQFVARQRRDAETIAKLQAELAGLQARLTSGSPANNDARFRRLKQEFSKRFHPDARPLGDPERALRELVFRELWPILDEIERS
ncbi:MAG TPA: hypothetical protein VMI30_11040 [Stellaceae bacterium]|nr:hypothetical protein [Stellaceae bacterium]